MCGSVTRAAARVRAADGAQDLLLEFATQVNSTFSNYDPDGAWPSLVDSFVVRGRVAVHGASDRLHTIGMGSRPARHEEEGVKLTMNVRQFVSLNGSTQSQGVVSQRTPLLSTRASQSL